jgi:hypothetical protein
MLAAGVYITKSEMRDMKNFMKALNHQQKKIKISVDRQEGGI